MRDTTLKNLIKAEENRQMETLDLIPSENIVSKSVLEALGSVLTNKYSEGYPGKRYYAGNEVADKIENLTKSRARKILGISKNWGINVQPYSGSPANMAVYLALIPIGGKIMGMRLDMGGHLTHGHKASAVGKLWKQIPYGVDEKTEMLNYDEILKIAKKEKPRLIIAGFTAYSRIIDFKKFRKIADAIDAIFMVDMSHFAGLVAGKSYPSPFKYADIVTTTTHKTLRGPRGAMIFSKKEFSEKIDKTVFPGTQGGPHINQIAATAAALYEAGKPEFKAYAKQIIKNAKTLTEELKKLGWRVISGGTDTHLILIDVFSRGIGGKQASEILEKAGIIVNKNTIPYDKRSPTDPSGIRLGTPTLTSRGMKEKEMKKIAELIDKVLTGKESATKIKKEVRILCLKFPVKR
ncbi:MAG: serine hydroxymethyltransferase [Spirochaetota bacterium]